MGKFNIKNTKIIFYISRLRYLLREIFFDVHATSSYSQEGEDMVLRRYFSDKRDGLYIDVGAHHPKRFSNTYYFYRRGWRGINIEPNPNITSRFQSQRPRDLTLQMGVSNTEGTLKYFMFNDPALNSFDVELTQSRETTTPYRVINTMDIPVRPLSSILQEHLPKNAKIDFLSVDVEGFDLQVLQSNNWEQFRPSYVLAESLDASLEKDMNSSLVMFMRENGYVVLAKTYNTLFFQDCRTP